MITLDDFMKHVKICERAEKKFPQFKAERINHLMDIDSAQQIFNIRLDDWLASDDENFFHDFLGLARESNRETYPCTFGSFVPRFAGEY